MVKTAHRAEGFTLAELLIALAFFMILSAMGFALTGVAAPSIRTDGQVNRVIGLLQVARETAITRQRDVEVRIDLEANSITVLRHEGEDEVPMSLLVLEGGVQLMQFDGMGDTPQEFGDATAADFGGSAALIFAPDGSFVGDDDLPLDGTLFFGMPDRTETARAVTLTGTTGRPRLYRWLSQGDGSEWVLR